MVKNRRYEEEGSKYGFRHLQCLLLFFCVTIAFALRVNLSVAIVAMTDKTSTNPNFEEYDWNEKKKSLILSSFFWGYVTTQVPGAALARKYGAKFTLLIGVFVCSIMTIFTPLAASYGDWPTVVALRVVEGMCQGVIFPSAHTLLSQWSPVEERGRLSTYTYSGSQFGTVVMLASSGFIASSKLGWPSIFYISGAFGVVWSVLFFSFGASSPAECKLISDEEKLYIETSLGKVVDDAEKKQPAAPWMSIATSLPFWSLLIVHCTHNWGFWTLLTQIPTYMKNVLSMDIKSNALLSALPYLVMMLLCYVFSFVADLLAKHECISLPGSRKLFNTIGHWVPMIMLIALAFTEQVVTAIILLTLTVGINSASSLGYQVNHMDLSPNFAGTLMGLTNCVANVMGIIAPLVVGVIVTEETNANQWKIVFFIAAGLLFIGNLFFITFGRMERQPWDSAEKISDANGLRRKSVEAVESQH